MLNFTQVDGPIAFCVGLTPTPFTETDISVEVYAMEENALRPDDLVLMVMDDSGESVMEAQPENSNYIECLFSGESGERFTVQIMVREETVTEQFLI